MSKNKEKLHVGYNGDDPDLSTRETIKVILGTIGVIILVLGACYGISVFILKYILY